MIIFLFLFPEKDFPQIKHSHDIWHAAKNIGKKIIKVIGHSNHSYFL